MIDLLMIFHIPQMEWQIHSLHQNCHFSTQHHQWTLKIIHNTFSEMQKGLYKAPQMVLQADTTNVLEHRQKSI